MELSNEDSLRVNVLLHQNLHAIRIDESKMVVYGLSDRGEAKIQLNPNCKDELYVKRVKELISTHVLGSPGGYPIYLRRWTRMGQARSNESLERLLQLGEPEAIVAVVHAENLSNEIARRAWWAMPNADNARCLLRNPEVVAGDMGRVLAEFLLEFLPFEEEPRAMIESVQLVLQQNLITNDERDDLWKKGQRRNAFLVGFLKSIPDELPVQSTAHTAYSGAKTKLENVASHNRYVQMLLQLLSPAGQAFLQTIEQVMKKPSNQDVVVMLCEAIAEYFVEVRPTQTVYQEVADASRFVCDYCARPEQDEQLMQLLQHAPELAEQVEAMLIFSMIGEPVLRPIFSRTDAVGSVMRKKLEPVFSPMAEKLAALQGNKVRK